MRRNNEKGYLVVYTTIIIFVISAIGFSVATVTGAKYANSKRNVSGQEALLAAEAGVTATMHQLNASSSFTGYATPQTFRAEAAGAAGKVDFTTTVSGDATTKTIVSVGRYFRSDSDAAPYIQRSVKAVAFAESLAASAKYTLFAGHGGLVLNGTLHTKNDGAGDVYSMGGLTMGSMGLISNTGMAADQHTKVNVANMGCGTSSGPYPVLCAGQPLALSSAGVQIYGDVCATGQTNSAKMAQDGLIADCTADVIQMPTFDKQAFINKMTTTKAANADACTTFFPNQTWSANTIYNGDKTAMTSGSFCNLTIAGDVYINGNLTINGTGNITVANGAGTTPPTIVVNGTVSFSAGRSITRNSNKTGVRIISLYSTDAVCMSNASCTSLSSTDHIYNSARATAITTPSGFSAIGSVFWAQYGKVVIGSTGAIGSAIGQTVEVSSGTTVGQMKQAGFPASDISPLIPLDISTTTWKLKDYQWSR